MVYSWKHQMTFLQIFMLQLNSIHDHQMYKMADIHFLLPLCLFNVICNLYQMYCDSVFGFICWIESYLEIVEHKYGELIIVILYYIIWQFANWFKCF